ncbi:MAG: metal ABC transporter permease [Bifidobacteriaceae bacterium]|jgi:zinc/manganese transport system permease protein|nr:metal ABC transporter permease [Bifidobacteriaceae bacterium]
MIELLQRDFVQVALLAAMLVSLSAGLVGYFVVIRQNIFFTHTLSHIGFPGAVLAILIGLDPSWGLIIFSTAAGLIFTWSKPRTENDDLGTGIILVLSMALGLVLTRFSVSASKSLEALLFGNIFVVTKQQLLLYAGIAILVVFILASLFKPLLYSSILEKEALAKGVNGPMLSHLYIVLLSLVVAVSVQVVGALLIFALLVLPPAAAIKMVSAPTRAFLVSPLIAMLCAVGGVILSLAIDLPASFCIVVLATLIYLIAIGVKKWLN